MKHAGSRSGSSSAQDSEARGASEELVFALCHEVGNLVGAIRLNAHLIDGDASAVELARRRSRSTTRRAGSARFSH